MKGFETDKITSVNKIKEHDSKLKEKNDIFSNNSDKINNFNEEIKLREAYIEKSNDDLKNLRNIDKY